jgi:hypothetical protein
MSLDQKTLSERLLDGARILGNLWRRGKRCKEGWDLSPADGLTAAGVAVMPCECSPRTEFCRARIEWVALAIRADRAIVMGPGGLAVTMSAAQWDLTGLTMAVESERAGLLRIGPKGTMSAAHLRKLSEDPESAIAVFSLTREFPKARVEGFVEPESAV